MEGEPGPLRSSEKQGVGHHTQARALWLREKAKTGIVGASNLVEKRVESPRPVKTQNSLRPQNVALEPKLEPTPRFSFRASKEVHAAPRHTVHN